MALLCGSRFRLSSHLTRSLQISTPARYPVKKPGHVLSPISCHTATNSVHLRTITPTGPPFLLCSNGRTVQIRSRITLPLPHGPVHHFHTSARLRALPAPLIWMVLKPLQKIMAIVLGRYGVIMTHVLSVLLIFRIIRVVTFHTYFKQLKIV